MGYSFSLEEEKEGMVQKIIDLCSFENLSNLEVNKSGQFGGRAHMIKIKNKNKKGVLFWKDEIGDWKNYLTSFKVVRLN